MGNGTNAQNIINDQVVAKLIAFGVKAENDEFMSTIHVFSGGKVLVFGVANETWGADVYAFDEHYQEGNVDPMSIDTNVPSDSTDIDAIVKAIKETL